MPQQSHADYCDSEFIHPELLSGEIFFSNSDASGFEAIKFKTKRKGNQSYDGKGNKLFTVGWFPIFLHQTELSQLAVSLSDIRKQLRIGRQN